MHMKYALCYPDAAGFIHLCHKNLVKSILMETDTRHGILQLLRRKELSREGKDFGSSTYCSPYLKTLFPVEIQDT